MHLNVFYKQNVFLIFNPNNQRYCDCFIMSKWLCFAHLQFFKCIFSRKWRYQNVFFSRLFIMISPCNKKEFVHFSYVICITVTSMAKSLVLCCFYLYMYVFMVLNSFLLLVFKFVFITFECFCFFESLKNILNVTCCYFLCICLLDELLLTPLCFLFLCCYFVYINKQEIQYHLHAPWKL